MSRWMIDYDSTLADTQTLRLQWTNEQFGLNVIPEQITAWDFNDLYTPEQLDWMWGHNCFLNEDFQAQCQPVPGAIEGMEALIDMGHHLMIVSDRPASLFDVTRSWLDAQGLDMVRLLFTHHKSSRSLNKIGMKTKVQAVHQHRLTHIVEDGPHHALAFKDKPYVEQIYLLDMPYNRHVPGDFKIHRVSGWDCIVTVAEAEALTERLVNV